MFLDEGKRGNGIAFLPDRNGHHPGRAIGPITSLSFVGFLVVGPAPTQRAPRHRLIYPRGRSDGPDALPGPSPGPAKPASERKPSDPERTARRDSKPIHVRSNARPRARSPRVTRVVAAPRTQHVTSPASRLQVASRPSVADRTGGWGCPVGTTARGWMAGPGDATRER
jgi:hypothetical protein